MDAGERELVEAMAQFTHDPFGFVMYAYPWGEKGTPLENQFGPDAWQTFELRDLGAQLKAGVSFDTILKRVISNAKIQRAVASGKGIGKSALVCWCVQYFLCTLEDTRGVLTAGTKTQLMTKTWPEMTKWYNMLICRHWFVLAATSLHSIDKEHEKIWRCDAIPWSEQNKEAFAGLHNLGKRQFVVFDEASQIADPIWETTDGIMTDYATEAVWLAFGNPTRNVGRFFDCFNGLRNRWAHKAIDSRTVAIADKAQIQHWVDDWGEDGDYVRVNVRGLFPRVSDMQFISTDLVSAARKREVVFEPMDPLILGVDVARYGNDETVMAPRKGFDARTLPWRRMRNANTQQIATAIAEWHREVKFDAIHIDGGGIGAGVVDRCLALNLPNVRDVQFGGKPDRSHIGSRADVNKYANKRAEMWGVLRDNLRLLALPDEEVIETDLINVMYGMNVRDEILLESKEDMKRRGLASPDNGDAIALTYAYPVLPTIYAGGPYNRFTAPTAVYEYNPFA